MKKLSLGQSTIYMTVASIGQKVISFVYFAIIARSLGAGDTGKYFFALSFTTIFVVFVDMGFTSVLVREGARLKEKISEIVSSVLFVKIFLGGGSYIAMAIVLLLLNHEFETQTLVFISGITMLFDSLQTTLYGTLRALGNVKYEAIGIIASQFITLILGTLFLYFELPLYFLMIAFLVPSFLSSIFAGYVAHTRYGVVLRPKYTREVVRYLVPITIPFALATIFGRILSYADSVMLSKMAGDVAVGWYSVPYKIAYAFQFIPFALIAGLYPRMSEYFVGNTKRFSEVFNQGLRYLLIVSVPLSVGIVIVSTDIITTFFGAEYTGSIVPLQILMCGIIPSFINILLGALLNAAGRQKIQTMIIGVMMCVNIALNILLIPKLGPVGAAIAATTGNWLITILSWVVVTKTVAIEYVKNVRLVGKLGIASLAMSLVVWYLAGDLQVAVRSVVGALVFGCVFILCKGVSREDIRYFKSLKK